MVEPNAKPVYELGHVLLREPAPRKLKHLGQAETFGTSESRYFPIT